MQKPSTGNRGTPQPGPSTIERPPEAALPHAPARTTSRRRKLLYWVLVMLALCTSFPLGAYLALIAAGRQSFLSTSGATSLTPVPTATLTLEQKQAQFIA